MEGLKARATTSLAKYPQLIQSLDKYWNPPRRAAVPHHRLLRPPGPRFHLPQGRLRNLRGQVFRRTTRT